MPMIVSICQHFGEQQFRNTVMCICATYTIFSAVKLDLCKRALLNVGGAMHFIFYINRLTTTKVDSTYVGCLTSNTQRICL